MLLTWTNGLKCMNLFFCKPLTCQPLKWKLRLCNYETLLILFKQMDNNRNEVNVDSSAGWSVEEMRWWTALPFGVLEESDMDRKGETLAFTSLLLHVFIRNCLFFSAWEKLWKKIFMMYILKMNPPLAHQIKWCKMVLQNVFIMWMKKKKWICFKIWCVYLWFMIFSSLPKLNAVVSFHASVLSI